MRARAVGDGSSEQRAIFESVSENRFEEVQIGNLFGIFQNTVNYKQRPEACHRPALIALTLSKTKAAHEGRPEVTMQFALTIARPIGFGCSSGLRACGRGR